MQYIVSYIILIQYIVSWSGDFSKFLYARRKTGRIVEWPCLSVCPSICSQLATTAVWRLTLYPIIDIACEHDILRTACQIDITFWYGLNITKTSDAIDLGHSTKTKMAATTVWRLTLYPIQNIACECDRLKPLVGLTSYFYMTLIPLRPWMLLIWGILQKPRWLPQ